MRRFKKNDMTNPNKTTNIPGQLAGLYKQKFGAEARTLQLPSSGSDRKYFRLVSECGPSAIGTWGEDVAENRSFVALSRIFMSQGINVPEIYAVADGGKAYLQQDLGDVSLLSLLQGDDRMRLSEETLRQLVEMQTVDESMWGGAVFNAPFSRRLVMWDLNYFKYEFLKPCGFVFDENCLEDDFERMADTLTDIDSQLEGFMYRDFQSRNVMVEDGKPWFIDYQGGRRGPIIYDVVSFLWQAKAGFSRAERRHLLDVYFNALATKRKLPVHGMTREIEKWALFRTLQVLGAYGFRGLVEKKAHFIESIPGAISNLGELLDEGVLSDYPELTQLSRQILASRFAGREVAEGLTVTVFSFSYKKGYPEDLSGNGGGFMFDCRGMHNPGRYEQYKSLTGLDKEVIDFLEERGEVQRFVAKAEEMVSPSVARYAARGFHNLQIGFGCTGGRHRSVYCAERLAGLLAAKHPEVRVRLIHREQNIDRTLNSER